MKVKRILVAIKGASTDNEILEFACSLSKRNKAEVYAIYVIEVKRSLPLDADIEPEVQKGEDVLARAESFSNGLGCRIQTELLQARDVGTAIVDEAVERGADIVVLGLAYKTRFGEFNTGKVVPYVLSHAPCYVWVLREAVNGCR